METEDKKAELLVYIQTLKDAGFRVYVPKDFTTYCWFVKDDKIGYAERGDFGFNIGTVHKPCREYGTGFAVMHDGYDPTVKTAERSLEYCMDHCQKYVKKYRGFDEFRADHWQELVEI